jgi:hypothetical protein
MSAKTASRPPKKGPEETPAQRFGVNDRERGQLKPRHQSARGFLFRNDFTGLIDSF